MYITLAARIEGQPSTVAPIGVGYEQVDPSTRRVIHALFPPSTRGYAFYTGLLANAIVTHDMLSHVPQEMRGDAAIVQVTGYAELSQYLGLSYDTTHMYVLIYRALGLLYLEKHDGLTTIILPLGAYRPPAGLGETLLQLRERYRSRRPKVGRLVSKIVERIVPFIKPASQPVFDQPPLHDELLTRVQQVLTAQDIADADGQIATRIVAAVAPFVTSHTEDCSFASERQEVHVCPPRSYQESKWGETVVLQESPSSGREEQVEERNAFGNLPATALHGEQSVQGTVPRRTEQPRARGRFVATNPAGGESAQRKSTRITTLSVKRSRFGSENLPNGQQTCEAAGVAFSGQGRFDQPNLPANHQAGYASQAAPEPMRKNLPIKVESKILSLNGNGNGKGENNINNIYLSVDTDSVPVPVRTKLRTKRSNGKRQRSPMPCRFAHSSLFNQARALAEVIEGNEENVGAYIALIKQHQPRTLRAAVIATFLRKHWPQGKGMLRRPGGYYTRRVQQFQHAIPEPILSLLDTYEQASYEEIDAAMGAQARTQAARQEPGTSARQGTIRPKSGAPMSKATAEALALRITQEDSYVQVRGVCEEEGVYAVRVYIAPVEHLFAAIEDWECYHAQMHLLEQEESA